MAKVKKPKAKKAAAKKRCFRRLSRHDRAAIIEECAKLVPTSWLDPLLTGPRKVIIDSPCPEIERLLRGVQDRIRGLATTNGNNQ